MKAPDGWTFSGWREPQTWELNQGYGPEKLWPIFQSDEYPLLEITRVRSEISTHRGWANADLHWLRFSGFHPPSDVNYHEADTCENWKAHAEIHGWELVREPVLQITVRGKPFKKQNVTELFSYTFDEWMEHWNYKHTLPFEYCFTPDFNEIVMAYEAWIEAKSIRPDAERLRIQWNRYVERGMMAV